MHKNYQFKYKGHNVVVLQSNGQFYFDPPYLAACLDVSDTHIYDVLDGMNSENVVPFNIDGSTVNFLTESGLHKLLMHFHGAKTEAVAFQEWVYDDLMPILRQTVSPEEYCVNLGLATQALSTLPEERLTCLERQLEELRVRVAKQTESIAELRSKILLCSEYYTIAGFATLRNVQTLDVREAVLLARKALEISRNEHYQVMSIDDDVYGLTHAYHISVLDKVFLTRCLCSK